MSTDGVAQSLSLKLEAWEKDILTWFSSILLSTSWDCKRIDIRTADSKQRLTTSILDSSIEKNEHRQNIIDDDKLQLVHQEAFDFVASFSLSLVGK